LKTAFWEKMSHLRHEKLSYELRGLIFEVHRTLKIGWPEEIYHQGLVQLLREKGLPVQSKPRRTIIHRGTEVHLFECDLIFSDLIILELKVLPLTTFAPKHYAQLIHYLKCWGKDLGMLVNFGPMHVQIERVIWDEPKLEIEQNYEAIKPYLTNTDQLYMRQVWQNILTIGQQYGLGYPETMYRKLVEIEMKHSGLNCQAEVQIPARWYNQTLAQPSSDHLLVEGKYLLNIRSLLDHPTRYDFARTKTYLNSLDLRIGLIVNFGKKRLQIYGVNPD
jgi:GxxExxY protein